MTEREHNAYTMLCWVSFLQRCGSLRYVVVRYDTLWFVTIRCGSLRYVAVRYDMLWYAMLRGRSEV